MKGRCGSLNRDGFACTRAPGHSGAHTRVVAGVWHYWNGLMLPADRPRRVTVVQLPQTDGGAM